MEIRVHGPGPGAAGARRHHAHSGERLRARGRLLPHRRDPRARRRPRHRRVLPRRRGRAGVQRRHRQAAAAGGLAGHERNFAANASCGLCGKTTLDQVEQHCAPVGEGPVVDAVGARDAARRGCAPRRSCSRAPAGCTRPASFTPDGDLEALREDIGRHNALDKLIGHAAARAAAAARRRRAAGLGARQLRDRAEGRGGRDPDRVRGVGAVEPRGRRGAAVRPDPGRVPAGRAGERLHASERVDVDR